MTDTQLYKVQDSGETGSNTTTSEIAFQTGFSEQNAFKRAFKR
jgi:AraC-like DNA-binding protein